MAYVKKYADNHQFRVKVGRMPDFSGAGLAEQEDLIGEIDGSNRVFKLKRKAFRNSESIYKDGLLMKRASMQDFSDGDYLINYATRTIKFSKSQTPQEKAVLHTTYRLI